MPVVTTQGSGDGGGACGPPASLALRRQRLAEIVASKALTVLDAPVRLSSGGRTSVFIDAKRGLSDWRDLRFACCLAVDMLTARGLMFDRVGGPTLGADALAVGIAAVSDTAWFVVRKRRKTHGTARWLEGAHVGPTNKVLLVDDVVTTGRSMSVAIGRVRDTGAEVVAATTVVDRGSTGSALIQGAGVPYLPMLTRGLFAGLGLERH